ncbi:substrate-binding domain-containing protein [Maridesulfovibrio ferrireducens]|uniref:substrate-binding domain-containing protein n=1 Tax=Maridesulfovibrio ferrireducens TaxID=246191 RepID=UPI001A20E10F|nr:substrate-binding domain-containing protein [Maridesulfovibrio ferrireducens]MBI9113091.1 substrate-binding domain-containing protein [Maridesulfovibrio ferrireducens]
MKSKLSVVIFLFVVTMLNPIQTRVADADAVAPKKLSIAVIPERGDLDFWKLLKKGAESTANEDSGIELLWIAPAGFGNFKEQKRKVDWCINNNVDAIVISPIRKLKMQKSLDKVLHSGIPIIQMVSETFNGAKIGCIHSDNFKGGMLAAEYLDKKLKGSGKVGLGLFKRGNNPVSMRVKGFKTQLHNSGSKIKVGKSMYIGGDSELALAKIRATMWSEGMDSKKNPKLDAVVGLNESSSEVILEFFEKMGKRKDLAFVVFNPDPEMIQKIEEGSILAGIAQDPYKIGRIAVAQAAMAARGKKIPLETVTEVYLVTKENLSQPKIQKILGLKERNL